MFHCKILQSPQFHHQILTYMIVLLGSQKLWALVLIQFLISCVILDGTFPFLLGLAFFIYRITRVVASEILQIKFYKHRVQICCAVLCGDLHLQDLAHI